MAKLRYNAERLICSAIVQEYHVIVQEGLEYSYVTNGIARILLRIPRDEPSTLYYFFCDPNSEVNPSVTISKVAISLLGYLSTANPLPDHNTAHPHHQTAKHYTAS